MLAYILAIAVAFGSFGLYMAAFFFPEIHRKNDFVWSGVGLFYALILWVCAGRITGAVLLGQTASVALLGWLGWQTVTLRRAVTPQGQQTPIPESVKQRVNQVLPSPSSTPPTPVEQPVTLQKTPEPESLESTPATPPQTTVPVEQQSPTGVEAVKEVAEDLIETTKDQAEQAAETTEELIETATDKAEDAAEVIEEWAETAADKAEDAAEVVEDWVETAKDKIEDTVEEVKEEAKTLSETRVVVKSKPKRQNPISQILGVVTGIFKGKQKPPKRFTRTEVPEKNPTPETPLTATESLTSETVEESLIETETVTASETESLDTPETG
jgi:ElaB/YqjD/DUF883 family membrane-anchored ribosome-binding protein